MLLVLDEDHQIVEFGCVKTDAKTMTKKATQAMALMKEGVVTPGRWQ